MDKVTVQTSVVLEALHRNRKLHDEKFAEAMAGYRARVHDKLAEMLQTMEGGADVKLNELYHLDQPTAHLEEYDTAIGMLELSVDDEVRLTAEDYQQYFKDNWDWSRQFRKVHADYTAIEGRHR